MITLTIQVNEVDGVVKFEGTIEGDETSTRAENLAVDKIRAYISAPHTLHEPTATLTDERYKN